MSNSGGIKLSTCQSLGWKPRGHVDDRCGGVPHVARFIQQRFEHQRDRQTDWTQPGDGAEASDFSDSPFAQKEIQEAESDEAAWKMAQKISEKLFSDLEGNDGIIETYLFWPKTRERLSDRAKYPFLVGLKPCQADYDAFPMPDFLYPIYWVVRPVRLFYQYGLKRWI